MSNTIGGTIPNRLPELNNLFPQGAPTQNGFGDALRSAIERVDEFQSDADSQVSDLALGKDQDIHSALIAVEKADISFQLMMQVRNKIVNAYQEIARMQF